MESLCRFSQELTSWKTTVQYHNQNSDIDTIHPSYSEFTSFACTHVCGCVGVCAVLCRLITCAGLCFHHRQDTEHFHHQ